MPIATTTDTPRLTRDLGEQIAHHLTPGPWASVQDDEDDEHGWRLTLRYVGQDDTLQGAMLTARVPVPHRGLSIEWTCHMWDPNHGAYLLDTLPYAHRKAWPGASINIGLAKAPDRIGRELSRRLLSYYLPGYREGMAGLARQLSEEAADGVLAAELATLAGVQAHRMFGQNDQPWRVYTGGAAGQVRLTCQYGRVRCEAFSMSPDQARQLVQVVMGWGKEQ